MPSINTFLTCDFAVGQHFVPLVITMVGLPARGKTILAYKIQQYLNWTNHKAKGISLLSFYTRYTFTVAYIYIYELMGIF